MVMPQVVVGGDPILPKGEYAVQVVKQELKMFKFGPSGVVDMAVIEGPYRGCKLDKLFNIEKDAKLNPHTGVYEEVLSIKPTSYIAGFLRTLDVQVAEQIGQPVSLEAMPGKYAIVSVEPKTDDKGGTRNNITAWRRYTGSGVNAPAPGAQPAAPVNQPPAAYPAQGQPAQVPGQAPMAVPVAPPAQPAAPVYPPQPAPAQPVLPTGSVPKW